MKKTAVAVIISILLHTGGFLVINRLVQSEAAKRPYRIQIPSRNMVDSACTCLCR